MIIGDADGVPNGRRMNFIHQPASAATWPELLLCQPKVFSATKTMPHFSPESLAYEQETDVTGIRLKCMRPPMKSPVNKGRGANKPKPSMTGLQLAQPGGDDGIDFQPPKMGELPKVPPSTERQKDEQSTHMSLTMAVDIVNQYKSRFKSDLELAITSKGYLMAQMIYGGDPNDD
jgi:hypothetical protein